jgi:hypothetical protein
MVWLVGITWKNITGKQLSPLYAEAVLTGKAEVLTICACHCAG